MATRFNIRVGYAERDAVATQLRDHYGDGLVMLDELNERLDQTLRARTGADLNAVVRDLPPLGSSWAGATADSVRLRAILARPGATASRSGAIGHGGAPSFRRVASTSGTAGVTRETGPGCGGALRGGSRDPHAARGVGPADPGRIPRVRGRWRPAPAIVLFLAALAMIRRLFGGRRFGRRYSGRCGRRW